jgi:hypothetical protein
MRKRHKNPTAKQQANVGTGKNEGYTRLAKRSRYSGAKCVGQTLSVLDPRSRSCSYRNICYDKKEEKFKIYVRENDKQFYKVRNACSNPHT